MEIYRLKDFAKWAKKEGLKNSELKLAIDEISSGLKGDRLGSHLFKKRIGIEGKGKRGGVRAIIFYKENDFSVFLYGFGKNEKDNLSNKELEALKILAKELSKLDITQREIRVSQRSLFGLED